MASINGVLERLAQHGVDMAHGLGREALPAAAALVLELAVQHVKVLGGQRPQFESADTWNGIGLADMR